MFLLLTGWKISPHSLHDLGSTNTVRFRLRLQHCVEQNLWSERGCTKILWQPSQATFGLGFLFFSLYRLVFCKCKRWLHDCPHVFWLLLFLLKRFEQITHLGLVSLAFSSSLQICPQVFSLPSVKNFRPQFEQVLIVNDCLVIPSILVEWVIHSSELLFLVNVERLQIKTVLFMVLVRQLAAPWAFV